MTTRRYHAEARRAKERRQRLVASVTANPATCEAAIAQARQWADAAEAPRAFTTYRTLLLDLFALRDAEAR